MKIISRNANEGLVIDGSVVVTVLEIQGKHVRLGISTPNQAPFYREEILFFDDGDGEPAPETESTKPAPEVVLAVTAL